MRFMIYPYTQNSEGAIAIAAELKGQRILRENSKYVFQQGDVIINWGASDCPYPQALNFDNKVVLDKLSFFKRLNGLGLTPKFWTNGHDAELFMIQNLAHPFPIFCRTKLKGRDGAGIVIADNAGQLVACDLYVEGVNKTSEYRVHVGRLPNGETVVIGSQKKVHGQPHPGQDARVWTGESTRFVWTVNGHPAYIPPSVTAVCIEAFKHFPELTFGAFDVCYCNNSSQAFVLEINSAPMMTPETARRYGDFFRKLAELEGNAAHINTPPPVPTPATIVAEPVSAATAPVLLKVFVVKIESSDDAAVTQQEISQAIMQMANVTGVIVSAV